MTGLTYPEGGSGRHIDTSRPVDWMTRHLNPAGFVTWMIVICLGLVLWPATLGGRLGLVMVAGTSMEPTYQLGDSVITWREPVGVGDVVLYRIPEGTHGEGNPVIHRIVGGNASAWITQGDNSELPDKWTPSNRDILGTPKLMIPMGGYFLNLMRSWWFIALLGGLATMLLLWPGEDPDGERRRGRHLATTS